MMIALVLFSVVIVSVDSSITVVQQRHVAMTNATEALDNIQVVQEALSTDIHAAVTWTTPAVPTVAPGSPVTASWTGSGTCGVNYGLNFTASLNNATGVISVCLNTATHVLSVTCTGAAACPGNSASAVTQAQVANIDSSSSATFTTEEVSTTHGGTTTNSFYYTSVATTLILDSPKVGAPHVSKTTITSPSLEVYNTEYACQLALGGDGATGSC